VERIAWKGLLARGSVSAAVSVIIGVSTLTPLIKYSPPASAPAVFAPLPVTNQSVSSTLIAAPIAKQPSPDFASKQVKVSTTADEAMPAVHSEQPRPTAFPVTQPLSDESSPTASQSAVQSAPPIIAATEQTKTVKSARAKRTAKTRKHARHRAPPFSYTRQIAWH
jgi:hypothetical protein